MRTIKTYLVTEACPCGNEAYRTTEDGDRVCGLCSLNVRSIADGKLGDFVKKTAQLLGNLLRAGSFEDIALREEIGSMIQVAYPQARNHE